MCITFVAFVIYSGKGLGTCKNLIKPFLTNYILTSQYGFKMLWLCSLDVCYTKNYADDFTDHGKQCPSRKGDVLVTKEERKWLMNGNDLREVSNMLRIHWLRKMNIHGLINIMSLLLELTVTLPNNVSKFLILLNTCIFLKQKYWTLWRLLYF